MVKAGIPTQAALAEQMGVTRQHLGAVLGGRTPPGRELLEKLARALMVNVSDLFVPSEPTGADGSPFIPIPMRAARRGVHVEAILDKSQPTARGGQGQPLADAGVAVYVDRRHAIAHNEGMIAVAAPGAC